jgi:penicillin amidase
MHIAWCITNGMVDECDFYIETIDSLDNNLYSYNNNWQKLTSLREKIPVNKQEPFYLTVFQTKNGPIVSPFKGMKGSYQIKQSNFQYNQDTILKGSQISMRWTGFEVSDEINGILLINRSENKSEFENGLRYIKVPGLNFTYTDATNIGYYLAAFVPIRKYQHSFLPVSGSSTKYDWQGFIPDNELPHTWNPSEKYIVTANNKILNEYPYLISNLWESPSRAERIIEILKYKDKFSIEDFQKMQTDVISVHAKKLAPIILEVLNKLPSNDNYYNQAITYLKNWDFSISVGSISSAIFNVFFIKMLKNTFLDEMGQDLFERYCFLAFIPSNVLTKLITENRPAWFDNINTPGKMESRDEIIYQSFIEAIEYLKEKLGPETKNWRWDALHRLTLRHPFGTKKPLDQIFNIGPYETAGSNTTINSGYYDLNNPFDHVVGPSMRFVVDMANINEPRFIISSGESGQPFSSHYQDQISLLLSGKYITIYNSPDKIRRMNYNLLRMEK